VNHMLLNQLLERAGGNRVLVWIIIVAWIAFMIYRLGTLFARNPQQRRWFRIQLALALLAVAACAAYFFGLTHFFFKL